MITPLSQTEPFVKLFINLTPTRYILIECPEGLTERVLNFVLSLTIPQIQTILSALPLKNRHLRLSYIPKPSIKALTERLLTPNSVSHYRALITDAPDMESLRWRERGVRLYPEVDVVRFEQPEGEIEFHEESYTQSFPLEKKIIVDLINSIRVAQYCPLTYLTKLAPLLWQIAIALETPTMPNHLEAQAIKTYILENFTDIFSLADPTVLNLVDTELSKRDPAHRSNLLSKELFHKKSLSLLTEIARQYRVSVPREGATLSLAMNEMIHLLKSNSPMTLQRYSATGTYVHDFWKIVIFLQLIDSYMYTVKENTLEVYEAKLNEIIKYILEYKGPKDSSIFLELKKMIRNFAKQFMVHPLYIIRTAAWPCFIDKLREEVLSLKIRNSTI